MAARLKIPPKQAAWLKDQKIKILYRISKTFISQHWKDKYITLLKQRGLWQEKE